MPSPENKNERKEGGRQEGGREREEKKETEKDEGGGDGERLNRKFQEGGKK